MLLVTNELEKPHFGPISDPFWPKDFKTKLFSRKPFESILSLYVTSWKKLQTLNFHTTYGPVLGPFWLKNLKTRFSSKKSFKSILGSYAPAVILSKKSEMFWKFTFHKTWKISSLAHFGPKT